MGWREEIVTVLGIRLKLSDKRYAKRQKKTILWGVTSVMQPRAKRGHGCAAESLVSEDINIL